MTRRQQRWSVLLATLVLSASLIGLVVSLVADDLAIDRALDAGGSWDYKNNRPDP